MALLESELDRIKYELGYATIAAAAAEYLSGYTAIFETVIANYLNAGATTTSTTPVTAADTPTAVDITLTSATGFTVGDMAVVDVDSVQERATVQALAGNVITVLLKLAHATSYPVTVEGGETIVRQILGKIKKVADQIEETALVAAGMTRAEDIEFAVGGDSPRGQLNKMLENYRQELADVLGVEYLRALRRGGGQSVVLT